MWQPEPGWQRLPGAGPATVGVWVTVEAGREVVIKRLGRPDPGDVRPLPDPQDVNYWRRAADVALSGVVAQTSGLREARVLRVEEDPDGVTLVHQRVARIQHSGLWLANCLGRFAGADLADQPWLASGQLRSRLTLVAGRGGWAALSRTPAAEVAARLWERRSTWLDRCDALPQVAQHGDAVPTNLPGRVEDDAIAIDWSHLGRGPVGADLGYLSLSSREGLGPLVDAYCAGLPTGLARREHVLQGARVTAVYTLFTRLDWVLSGIAEPALANLLHHPDVTPYLPLLQRQAEQIEWLLT